MGGQKRVVTRKRVALAAALMGAVQFALPAHAQFSGSYIDTDADTLSNAGTPCNAALVKTIQTDTNEAVMSMEQTTVEVVGGAKRAQDAGVALEEIETVSSSLAELIQNISNAARQQAAGAGHVSNRMNVIQEITANTAQSSDRTAQSIGNLSSMANAMKESVEGF